MTPPPAPRTPEFAKDAESVPIGSRYVRSFLNRHDVPSARHVIVVANLLGVNYTLVHRRMNGSVAWELEEIEKVAAHFGKTLADVFSAQGADEYVDAMLAAGPVRVPCRLVVGKQGQHLQSPFSDSTHFAIRERRRWFSVRLQRSLGHAGRCGSRA